LIIPLVGFFIACTIFAGIGAAVLVLVPKLSLTVVDVVLFVVGAVPSSLVGAVVYGWVFGDQTGELRSTAAVLGVFFVLLVAGLCGGLLLVLVHKWLRQFKRLQRDSGSPVGH